MKKLNKKGFSLVELIIVIAVIAILAAVLIPTFSNMIKRANESAVLQAARSAYEEALTMDLADGSLDGYEGEKNVPANSIATKLSKEGKYTVTITPGESDYASYVYKDLKKNLTAIYDGSTWVVQ